MARIGHCVGQMQETSDSPAIVRTQDESRVELPSSMVEVRTLKNTEDSEALTGKYDWAVAFLYLLMAAIQCRSLRPTCEPAPEPPTSVRLIHAASACSPCRRPTP